MKCISNAKWMKCKRTVEHSNMAIWQGWTGFVRHLKITVKPEPTIKFIGPARLSMSNCSFYQRVQLMTVCNYPMSCYKKVQHWLLYLQEASHRSESCNHCAVSRLVTSLSQSSFTSWPGKTTDYTDSQSCGKGIMSTIFCSWWCV